MKNYFKNIDYYPWVTHLMLAIMVLMYLLMSVSGGSTNAQVLVDYGAKFNPLIIDGQYWRFLTPVFLHIGFNHLLLNGITLYFLGLQVEALFGHWRYAILFLLTGVGGNIASFAFSNALSAGASTAIFGLFGAFLMLGESFPNQPYIRQLARTFILFIVLNLVFDLFTPGIDLAGHLGGLAAGFFLGYVVGVPNLGKIPTAKRILSAVVILIGFSWLVYHGLSVA